MLVRMGSGGKERAKGDGYLGEVGELAAELGRGFLAEESVFVFVNGVLKGFARAEKAGGTAGVVAEPELRVGFVMLDAEVGSRFWRRAGRRWSLAPFCPKDSCCRCLRAEKRGRSW